jgi:hypothetical protein
VLVERIGWPTGFGLAAGVALTAGRDGARVSKPLRDCAADRSELLVLRVAPLDCCCVRFACSKALCASAASLTPMARTTDAIASIGRFMTSPVL